jgi:hypothetical protein
MFNDNRYSAAYHRIVERAKAESRSKSSGGTYELHHILPRSLGGSNRASNLVLLTPKEHYVCHLLLTKMVSGNLRYKMIYAFFRMKGRGRSAQTYALFCSAFASATKGSGNPFFGRKHSEETLLRISGNNHHMSGKCHSNESRQKMSLSKKGRFTGEKNPMFGVKHSEEWKASHSSKLSGENHFNYGKPAFNKGRIWVNNGEKSLMISPDSLDQYHGWVRGRLRP